MFPSLPVVFQYTRFKNGVLVKRGLSWEELASAGAVCRGFLYCGVLLLFVKHALWFRRQRESTFCPQFILIHRSFQTISLLAAGRLPFMMEVRHNQFNNPKHSEITMQQLQDVL